ncbi:MAG: YqjD family protein [Phycisphaerae bacterium]
MATDYEKAFDALRKDMGELRADVSALMDSLKESAKAKAAGARERVEETARKGAEHVKDAAEALRECGRKVKDHAVEALEDKPVLVLLAAVGLGAILGSLVAWRHSR